MNNKHVYSPRQSIKLHCVRRGTQCTIFIVCIRCMLLYYYSFCFLWQPSRREICTGRWIFHHMTEKHQEMKSISGKSKQRMWTTRIACDLRAKGVPAVSACMQTCTVWLSNCLRASDLPLQYPRSRHLCVCVWERAREPLVCSWSPALSDRRITVATLHGLSGL